jgi:hypothetical protein
VGTRDLPSNEEEAIVIEEQAESSLTEETIRNAILEDDETYICMALASESASKCGQSPKKIENCYNSYYLYRALIYGEDNCDKITDSKNIICNAVISNDEDICDNIGPNLVGIDESPDEFKLVCNALVKEDPFECKSLIEGETENFCENIVDMVITIKDENLDKCLDLRDYHDYLKCRAVLLEDANVCIEQRLRDELDLLYN